MDILKLLNRGFVVRDFPKETIIYEPDTLPRYVYFIKSGEVRMVTVSKEGKEFIQGIFKAGQYFGEPALILNRKYLAFTITNKPCEIIQLNREQFFGLIANEADFSISLIQTLSNRLFYKSMMLEELANEKAEHRLITMINHLLSDIQSGEILKVTRQELADMTGLRVETVIREIKQLSKAGLISLIKGKIYKP